MGAGTDKALALLKNLPRVTITNVRPIPGQRIKPPRLRGQHHGYKRGLPQRGQRLRNRLPTLGHEGGQVPFIVRIPTEPYYKGHHVRRQYPPLSLLQLQRLVDLGRVNPEEPIDLTTLCNTKIITVNPQLNHYGINLTAEGADIFCAKVNIEVQWTDETTIAAIERAGGMVTTRYYDPMCVEAMVDSLRFFKMSKPIPRCKLPPEDAVLYYSDAKNRGYLADPDKIREKREELAQKYGYVLPDVTQDSLMPILLARKHPRQIWYGLEPGWVVSLRDKTILKPTSEQLQAYYSAI